MPETTAVPECVRRTGRECRDCVECLSAHPAGKTCADCRYMRRCKAFAGIPESQAFCDWIPSAFITALPAAGPARGEA